LSYIILAPFGKIRAPGKVNGYEKPGAAEGFKIPECFVC
jgi:hypothetical protein